MKKVIKIIIPIILIAVIIPTAVWGVSRLQLKSREAELISGVWAETLWNAADAYVPDDSSLYYTVVLSRETISPCLCLPIFITETAAGTAHGQ